MQSLGGKSFIFNHLRWLVPVFHARAHVRLPTGEDPLARKAKQIWRRSALFAKGYFALFEKKVVFTEIVSPRKFLLISIYGRKMLSELNARVLETSSHLCCDRSCRDRGPRNSSMFNESQSNFQVFLLIAKKSQTKFKKNSMKGILHHLQIPFFHFYKKSASYNFFKKLVRSPFQMPRIIMLKKRGISGLIFKL